MRANSSTLFLLSKIGMETLHNGRVVMFPYGFNLTPCNRCVYFGYMTKTLLNIKVDTEVKTQAKKLAASLGLPLSTIVNAQLKRFVDEKEIRFVSPVKMSKKLERMISLVEKDIQANRNLSPVFKSGKEMDEYLASL